MHTNPSLQTLTDQLRRMPKVDLHRHLEGSLRLGTLAEIAGDYAINLPSNADELATLIQVNEDEPKTAENFLAKFKTLRSFFKSIEIISRIVGEVVADAAADGILYLELLFTPQALAADQNLDLKDVFDAVSKAASEAANRHSIQVKLIASINRHEPLPVAERVVQLALERQDDGLVGLDLAGDESHFGAEPFKQVFIAANQGGLGLTVHAGEWGGADNIRVALEELGAQRIGHGVRMLEDQQVLEMVRSRHVPCEVCLTSNRLTGVDDLLPEQPLTRLLQAGLQVTLNSDDPTILRTSLSQELAIGILEHGLTVESLKGLTLAAAQAAFLPRREKQSLEKKLISGLMDFRLETDNS